MKTKQPKLMILLLVPVTYWMKIESMEKIKTKEGATV